MFAYRFLFRAGWVCPSRCLGCWGSDYRGGFGNWHPDLNCQCSRDNLQRIRSLVVVSMDAIKEIVGNALTFFIQFGLFILCVIAGRSYSELTGVLVGLAAAALIISYNDYTEKLSGKKDEQRAVENS